MEAEAPLPEVDDVGEIHKHRADPMRYINEQTEALRVRKKEKDKFGEVFTPLKLINDMLDKLPAAIWSDPNKKWLDPATGIGNFPMMVYARLMNGLATYPDFTDQVIRSQHIIRRMIYMVELNPESCARIRSIFGSAANLFCSSFLNQTIFTDGTTQFDVIVGNPPFNSDQTHQGKKGGGSNLWPKFVEKSLDIMLAPRGYLLFVHPALWRKPPSDRARTLFDKMVHDNHMAYVEIHNKPDGFRDFRVHTRYDYYLIQNIRPTQMRDFTTVKDQLGMEHQLDLSRWRFLPNHSFELIKPLLSDKEENYVIFSRGQYGSDKSWVSNSKDDEYNIPLVHSTPSNGPRFYWSSKKNEHCKGCKRMFDVLKVIFGESGINNAIIDYEGKYGMTQGAIGLKISREGEGELMKSVLESEEFHRILDAMSFSNFRIDWRMFLYFRPDFYRHPQFVSRTPFLSKSVSKKQLKRAAAEAAEEEPSMSFVQSRGAQSSPRTLKSNSKRPKHESNQGGRKRNCRNFTKLRKRNSRYTRKKY